MSEVSFGKTVSLEQAAQLILACPDLTFFLEGEPGIGKSTIIKFLEEQTGYPAGYVDVGNLDLGDTGTPMPNRDLKITEYYPNGRFNLHLGKPVIIMLDEFTKGNRSVQNMLHPLFEKTNPRFGDISLAKGSIVFLTGNCSTDGVGDTLAAHTLNRIVRLRVRKPSADAWIAHAIGKGWNPTVIAWVSRYPHVADSYMDAGTTDNPYIFNPKFPRNSFVSYRSLESACTLVDQKDNLPREALIAALSGAIGEAGARELEAFVQFADQLPAWESVVSDPDTAMVPTAPGACAVAVFGAISRVDKASIAAVMRYVERFSAEWQAVFAINIAKNPQKQAVAFGARAFTDWVAKNQDLL